MKRYFVFVLILVFVFAFSGNALAFTTEQAESYFNSIDSQTFMDIGANVSYSPYILLVDYDSGLVDYTRIYFIEGIPDVTTNTTWRYINGVTGQSYAVMDYDGTSWSAPTYHTMTEDGTITNFNVSNCRSVHDNDLLTTAYFTSADLTIPEVPPAAYAGGLVTQITPDYIKIVGVGIGVLCLMVIVGLIIRVVWKYV